MWPFPLLWLVAFATACTTLQAVTSCIVDCLMGTSMVEATQATYRSKSLRSAEDVTARFALPRHLGPVFRQQINLL